MLYILKLLLQVIRITTYVLLIFIVNGSMLMSGSLRFLKESRDKKQGTKDTTSDTTPQLEETQSDSDKITVYVNGVELLVSDGDTITVWKPDTYDEDGEFTDLDANATTILH